MPEIVDLAAVQDVFLSDKFRQTDLSDCGFRLPRS